MDAVSYSHADRQKQRIEKVIAQPDSTSGLVSLPSSIASGETITIPSGRTVVHPNLVVSGTLDVQGTLFVPAGGSVTQSLVDATVVKQNGNVVANDSAVVHKTGNETKAGVLTLTDGLKLQGQNVSPFSGFKNYIINGNKVVNQRALTSTDNSYNQDRWYKSGLNWYQGIEGGNNSISGKTYTLSWVGAATASYYVGTATSSTINAQSFTSIANGGNFTLTISAGQNLWIKFESDATGSTFNFVQLEEGSVATPFEQLPYGLELSLCQRYYEVINNIYRLHTVYGCDTTDAYAVERHCTVPFAVQKRTDYANFVSGITYTGAGVRINGGSRDSISFVTLDGSTNTLIYTVASIKINAEL